MRHDSGYAINIRKVRRHVAFVLRQAYAETMDVKIKRIYEPAEAADGVLG